MALLGKVSAVAATAREAASTVRRATVVVVRYDDMDSFFKVIFSIFYCTVKIIH